MNTAVEEAKGSPREVGVLMPPTSKQAELESQAADDYLPSIPALLAIIVFATLLALGTVFIVSLLA
jgi:hypothetical protein